METFAATYAQLLPVGESEGPRLPLAWLRLTPGTMSVLLIAASLSASALPAAANRRVLTPHGGCLNVRSGPGMEYSVVNCLASGTALTTTQAQGTWVQLSNGNWTFGPYTVPATAAGTGGRPPCPDLNGRPVLDLGSRGASVVSVQQSLQRLGYSTGPTGADGVYGPQTKAAVTRFQKDQGLVADGRVGPQTWEALAKAGGSSGNGSGTGNGGGGSTNPRERVSINPVDANAEIITNATVRLGPNPESEPTGEILRPGGTVTVMETLNDWHRLKGSSLTLWVPAGSVQRFF